MYVSATDANACKTKQDDDDDDDDEGGGKLIIK